MPPPRLIPSFPGGFFWLSYVHIHNFARRLILRNRDDLYLWPVPEIYATAKHLSTGEVIRTLGPFETHHAARSAVVEAVGQVLLWERQSTGAFVAEKYPTLWVVGVRSEGGRAWPPGPNPLA